MKSFSQTALAKHLFFCLREIQFNYFIFLKKPSGKNRVNYLERFSISRKKTKS